MKKNINLVLDCLSLLLYIISIILFVLPFASSPLVNVSGFELAFTNVIGNGITLGTLFAFIFIIFAVLNSILAVTLRLPILRNRLNAYRARDNLPLLIKRLTNGLQYIIIGGLLPFILIMLSINLSGLGGYNFHLGIGAILSAIFALLGGIVIFISESNFIRK